MRSTAVHKECRKTYTREQSIRKEKREAEERERFATLSNEAPNIPRRETLRREVNDKFDFRSKCLICGEEINSSREKKKPQHVHREFYTVRTLTFKNSVLKVTVELNNKIGRAICKCLCNVIDLVAKEGNYHDDCSKNLFASDRPVKPHRKLGRQELEDVKNAMNEICTILKGVMTVNFV